MKLLDRITSEIRNVAKSRIAKNSFYNVCGFSAQTIFMLVITPILIAKMGVKQYGLWMIANSVLGAIGILDMGLGMGITKYVAEYVYQKDIKGLSSTVYGSIVFYLLISLLLTFPLYIFMPTIVSFLKVSPDMSSYAERSLQIIAFGLVPALLIQSGLSILLGLQRFDIANALSFAKSATTQINALVIFLWYGQIIEVLIGQVIILYIFAFIILMISFHKLHKTGLIFYFSWAYGKSIFSFSSHIFLQNIGARIFSSIDKLVVGRLLGFEAVTYYSIGTDIASKIVQVNASIFQSFLPAASEAVAINNYPKLYNLFRKGMFSSILLNLLIGSIIIILSKPFLQYWMGTDFMQKSLSMFRILILVYALFSICTPAYYLANGIGIPWICTIGSVLGGSLTIFLIFLLSESWQLKGAAWANIGYNVIYIIPLYINFVIKHKSLTQYG
jgi:O-antigen/teichoic acid export membrane protein